MRQPINLNEECLLEFLTGDPAILTEAGGVPEGQGNSLSENLRRIFRRNQYVSFPPAIVIRRS